MLQLLETDSEPFRPNAYKFDNLGSKLIQILVAVPNVTALL